MESSRRVAGLCTATENTECSCSVEGNAISSRGSSQTGDLAASAKHDMSTAGLQMTLIKDVIRGSIRETAPSPGLTEMGGLLREAHGA